MPPRVRSHRRAGSSCSPRSTRVRRGPDGPSTGGPLVTNPVAAVDPTSGNLYLAWEDYSDNELFFIGSADRGETWSEPVNIVDEEARPANQTWPGISVAPDGRIDLAWHDFPNDPFAAVGEAAEEDDAVEKRYWDVYYMYSEDGGRTWASNLRVTDRVIDGDVGATFTGDVTRARRHGAIREGSTVPVA